MESEQSAQVLGVCVLGVANKTSPIIHSYFLDIDPSFHANSKLSVCCQKVLFLSHLTTEPGFSQKFQHNPYGLILVVR